MYARLNQEMVNDTAKLIMHRLIAQSLARDPTLVARARASLSQTSIRFPGRSFIADWEELLRLPARQLRARLTSRDQEMKRLRLSSPFVTAEGVNFDSEDLRRRIRRAARRITARSSRSNAEGNGIKPMAT
jgi:hypothetical protein